MYFTQHFTPKSHMSVPLNLVTACNLGNLLLIKVLDLKLAYYPLIWVAQLSVGQQSGPEITGLTLGWGIMQEKQQVLSPKAYQTTGSTAAQSPLENLLHLVLPTNKAAANPPAAGRSCSKIVS